MRGNIYDRLSEGREREERIERERPAAELSSSAPSPQNYFYTNEISFVRPEALKDKTFHVFSYVDEGPSPLSVVIGRSHVGADANLEILTQQLLDDVNKSLSHLHWIDYPAPAEVAGVEARRLEYTWRQQGKIVNQIQFLFIAEDEYGLRLLMQITATGNDPKGMSLEERALFDSIIESVQFRSARDKAVNIDE